MLNIEEAVYSYKNKTVDVNSYLSSKAKYVYIKLRTFKV